MRRLATNLTNLLELKKAFLIIFTILFISQFSNAQKIEPGKYVSVYDYSPTTGKSIPFGEYSHTITILNERTFKYVKDYCGEVEFGFGTYTILKNKIAFDFLKIPDSIQIFPFIFQNEYETKNDSLIYDVHVLYDNKALEYARIYCNGEVKIYQTETGISKIVMRKSDIPVSFNISYVGYGQVKFTINDSLSKEIIVNLDSPNKTTISNSNLTYKIKDIGKNGFYIRGEFWKEWTFFKREE